MPDSDELNELVGVAKIRAELKAATPGPWYPNLNDLPLRDVLSDADDEQICDDATPANARLIANAPTYLAALCDVVERLCNALRFAEGELERWGWGDMRYGAQRKQEPSVVTALEIVRAALAEVSK